MEKKLKARFVRVTVYLNHQEYRLLKSKLTLQGLTVSEWFRQKIREFLDEE